MLNRVFGPAGSGKTGYLYGALASAVKNNEPCVWITPETQSFQTERSILFSVGNDKAHLVEVMTFGEMPDRVARLYGGSAATYLDKGAMIALLSVLVSRNKQHLSEYGRSAEDPGFLSGLLRLFKRLRYAMITPDRLEEAAEGTAGAYSSRLRGKLQDIALLFRAYDASFSDGLKDSGNRLTELAKRLPSCPYFEGKNVFLDGFYRFHEQELAVLAVILRQAKAVWCGFAGDGGDKAQEREQFSGIRASADRLTRFVAPSEVRDHRRKGFLRSDNPALRFLEANLWKNDTPVFGGDRSAIRLLCADNAFDESHAAASRIMELVRGGMRFRDITVFVRNPSDYAGILDEVFRTAGIPYFFSTKADISANPLIAFVCALLEMSASNYTLSSVRKYLKTGYSGLTTEESDLLLRYAESWSLRGSAWTADRDWIKNPDGFRSGDLSAEQAAALAAVNAARELFVVSLKDVRSALKGGSAEHTVDGIIAAVYSHLLSCGADGHFVDRVNRFLARGEEETARRESQIWEIMVSIFDRLHDICGSEKMTVARFLTLFRLTADQYTVSTIPPSLDCVTIGDPVSLCPDSARAVFLLGCNEGVFPAAGRNDSLFDEAETVRLCELDLPVGDALDDRMTEERYYFYTAVTAPSEKLFLSYSAGTVSGDALRPSFAVNRIRALFPGLEPEAFSSDPESLLYSAAAAANIFPLLPEGQKKDEIRAILNGMGYELREGTSALLEPAVSVRVDADGLSLSPSALERYRYCPFSFFGLYLMKLKEKKRFRFAQQEMGSLLHRVLEEYLRSHISGGSFTPPPDEQTMNRETDALFERFLDEAGSGGEVSEQFRHTCRNYKKTVRAAVADLTEEFRQSRFLPVGFEVPVGRKGKNGLPAVEVLTEDGRKLLLTGIIDRVDRCTEEEKTYVRVVDYKTYDHDLNLDRVKAYGLDEQMLLYLLACCERNGGAGGTDRPAGVLYNRMSMKTAELTGTESDEEREKKIREAMRIQRSGVLLGEEPVLRAMDASAENRYVPAVFKDGRMKTDCKSLLTEAEFRDLFRLIRSQVAEDGKKIFSGKMDIRPLPLGKNSEEACKYCYLKNACRHCGDAGGTAGAADGTENGEE